MLPREEYIDLRMVTELATSRCCGSEEAGFCQNSIVTEMVSKLPCPYSIYHKLKLKRILIDPHEQV
jgi:hypothetical protein